MNPAEIYILNRPEPFKTMLMHIQLIIEQTIEDVELKYKWKIPMYYSNDKPLCYLNASIKKGYVDVAFWSSVDLPEYDKYLVIENRKVVRSMRYFSIEEIDGELLASLLKKIQQNSAAGFYSK